MSTQADMRKRVRIIASNSLQRGNLRTVNIRTTAPLARDAGEIKECVQVAGALALAGTYPTWMDSGGNISGLPTVYINGYSAPS